MRRGCFAAPQAGMPPALAAACTANHGHSTSTRVQLSSVPDWDTEATPAAPHPPHGDGHLRGWHARDAPTHTASRALLLSQAGPTKGVASVPRPTSAAVLLLPRAPPGATFMAPAPHRACAAADTVHPLEDHRLACATSGVLASRALPLEMPSPAFVGRGARESHATSGSLT